MELDNLIKKIICGKPEVQLDDSIRVELKIGKGNNYESIHCFLGVSSISLGV